MAASRAIPAASVSDRISRRAFIATGAASTALTALPYTSARAAQGEAAQQIVIYHTNDTHGYLQANGSSVAGIDYVAGLRASTPNSLLLDAGDFTQGAPLASLTQGATPVTLMNAAGYDAACLGNHEFDFGVDVLLKNVADCAFPVLSANAQLHGRCVLAGVQDAGADGCSAMLTCGGHAIGVFGLTTQATAWSVNPAGLGEVAFSDEVAAAEEQIASLVERGAETVVCLAHLGNGDVPCTGAQLAENLSPEAAAHLAVIIDGHSHTIENAASNGVLVVQTGCNLANVGKLTLTFGSDGSVSAAEELLDAASVDASVQPDAEVTADVDAAVAEQDVTLSEQVCVNPGTLWAGWVTQGDVAAPTRMVETNLGDFVCECFVHATTAYLAQAGLDDGTPVVAVENGGGIRAAFPRGILTLRDLVTTFPFSNTVQVKRVTPRLLCHMLEVGAADMGGQDASTGMLLQTTVNGSYLQFAGFEATLDASAPVGQRVRELYVHGLASAVDLDDDETQLYLASNGYVTAGGGGFDELGKLETVADLGGELEVVRAYVAELACALPAAEGEALGCLPLPGAAKGRLSYADVEEPGEWEATLRLVDASGASLSGTDVLLEVDSGELASATSDADGLVRVVVPAGGHAVAAYDPSLCDLLTAQDGTAVPAPSARADASGAGDRGQWARAVARTLAVVPAEAYVDNHMGVGLVEDDLRSYPTLTLTTGAQVR